MKNKSVNETWLKTEGIFKLYDLNKKIIEYTILYAKLAYYFLCKTIMMIAYTVQNGDTLRKIAQKFRVPIPQLRVSNYLTSMTIRTGQILYIPNTTGSYTVQAGDTLYQIAKKFGTTTVKLKDLNQLTSNFLRGGQRLMIPQNLGSRHVYTVKEGDNIWNIGTRFGVLANSIKEYNRLSSNNLQIGKKLIIPTLRLLRRVREMSFTYSLELQGSVGIDGDNLTKDVEKVQNQLLKLGFLTQPYYNQERLLVAQHDKKIIAAYIVHTIESIKKFQATIIPNNPVSGLIAPNSVDLMLLQTAVLPPKQKQYAIIKRHQNMLAVKAENGQSLSLSSPVGNVQGGNKLKDLKKVQERLLQLGYLTNEQEELTLQAVSVEPSQIPRTIQAIEQFQRDKVFYWVQYPTVTNTMKGISEGIIYPEDLTFKVLKEYTIYTLNFITPDQTDRKINTSFHNYIQSRYSIDINGIRHTGNVDPEILTIEEYMSLGLSRLEAKALRYVSKNEGNFDAINTYDKAIFSYGFIQFAGKTGGLANMLAVLKHRYEQVFVQYFQYFGIDVEYAIKNGKIVHAQLVVISCQTQKAYRGIAAEQQIKQDKLLLGTFIRAAYCREVMLGQVESAKLSYVEPALQIKVNFELPIIKVWDINRTKVIDTYIGKEADNYRLSESYKTYSLNNQVEELALIFDNQLLTEIIRSEKGITTSIDLTVNQWINKTRQYFTQAIIKIATKEKLISKEDIYSIDEVKVLQQIIADNEQDTRIARRIKNILTASELSAVKPKSY